MYGLHFTFLVSALLWLTGRAVQGTKMCGMLNQRTAIVGDRLYFAGGNYDFDDGEPLQNTTDMYALDLSKPVDVSGPVSMDILQQSKLPTDGTTDNLSSVAGGSGVFFSDHTMLYAYGGDIDASADGTQNELWGYNTSNGVWSLVSVEGGELSFGKDTDGAHASDPASSRSFYTGGSAMAYNDTNNGVVKFDSSEPSALQWAFETAQTGIQGPDIFMGAMVYVRKGRAGILAAFGGYNTTHRGTEFGPGWDWDQASLADIFVYDIFSNAWFLVQTTGDVPSLRSEFCAGVSAAPDDSSFQITIHGGWDLFNSRSFSDVYVLSIPAFQWIAVDATHSPDDDAARHRHKCDMWQDGQMIVSGGVEGGIRCNESYPPFKVLDTSTYAWSTQFQPDVKYTVPDVVSAVIGGDSNGGSTTKEPQNGWSDPALYDIFAQTVPRDNYITPNSTTPVKAKNTDSSGQTTNRTAAISGSVVGGFAALAILIIGSWLFVRRRRQRRQQHYGYRHAEDELMSKEVRQYVVRTWSQNGNAAREPFRTSTRNELLDQSARAELCGDGLAASGHRRPEPLIELGGEAMTK